MRYILSESTVNTVILFVVLKKIMAPFNTWDAYKLGLIDENGKKLKEPVTSKELASWDLLTKFVWNFKKIINKFVGKSKIATYLSAAFLLKDSINLFYIDSNKTKLNETLLADFTFEKQNIIYDIIQSVPISSLHEKVTEDNFEILMHLYIGKFEKILETTDFEKKVVVN